MSRTLIAWLGVLAVAAVLLVTGCAGVAWLVAQFEPLQKVKALYKPPPGKTVLVFVDDILNPVRYQPVKAELTERLNGELAKHKIAAATVPYEKLVRAISTTRDFDRLSVAEVGRMLGAELVLYVHIDKFSIKDEEQSPLWHGELVTTVRLVDVAAGRLWPQDRPEGYSVPAVETPIVDNSSAAYGGEVARQLTERMADQIAKLFYDHTAAAGERQMGAEPRSGD